jgi:hypothetical protein
MKISRMVVMLFLKLLLDSIHETRQVEEETPLKDLNIPDSGKKRIFNADIRLLRLI